MVGKSDRCDGRTSTASERAFISGLLCIRSPDYARRRDLNSQESPDIKDRKPVEPHSRQWQVGLQGLTQVTDEVMRRLQPG